MVELVVSLAIYYSLKKAKLFSDKIIVMGGGGYNAWITLRAWIYNLSELIGVDHPIILNKKCEAFLENLDKLSKPKANWLNSIEDTPNIF